jgi:chlorite dismutase
LAGAERLGGGGAPLAAVGSLAVLDGACVATPGATWALRGVVGHERYVKGREHEELAARSPRLGRPEATRAALIPIRKLEAWWALPQDERRAIFEERSRHIATGLKYLPAVARRLHHSRELGEPFDFLTWFEFAPADEAAFDELTAMLRATDEMGLRRARGRYPPGTVGGPREGVRPQSLLLRHPDLAAASPGGDVLG